MTTRYRPGLWSVSIRCPEYDVIRFDCCRTRLAIARSTVELYRFCPVCGHRLEGQRETRPSNYPAWAWRRGIRPPEPIRVQKPEWFLEESSFPTIQSSWRTVSRIYYDCPVRQTREHIADLDPDSLLSTVHFRLAYRYGSTGRLVGTVSRPAWQVRPRNP